jgi:hypothetical protein
MPAVRRTPSYRHHQPSGQAVVTLNDKDHYLRGGERVLGLGRNPPVERSPFVRDLHRR